MSLTALLSTHTNLLQLGQKYNFSIYKIKHLIDEDIIRPTNETIKIDVKKTVGGNWDSMVKLVNEILKAKLKCSDEVNKLLTVVNDLNVLVNSISTSMVNKLRLKYDRQRFWTKLTSGTVSEKFHYLEKFETRNEVKGHIEYLEVTCEGHIECGQKAFGTNEVHIRVKIRFRAIMMRCDLIAWNLDLPVTGSQFMCELKWDDSFENCEMSAISFLSAYTNFIELSQKYNFSISEIEHLIEEDIIQLTNEIIKIDTKKNVGGGWDSVVEQVKMILKTKLKSINKVNLLLAVVHNLDGLVNSISTSIINEIRTQYDHQGIWAPLTSSTVSEEFHYFEKFETHNEAKGHIEYLEVACEGHIECGQKAFGTNEVQLRVNIRFRAITMRCDLISFDLNLPVTGSQLMCELKWDDPFKNCEMSVISFLSTFTNCIELSQKYNFSISEIEHLVEEDIVQVTNEIIKIDTMKNVGGGWDSIVEQVKVILKTKLKNTNKVNLLLAVVHNLDGLVNSISTSIINEIRMQHDHQGIWAHLTSSTVSEEFHYFEKFETHNEAKGHIEYLEVACEGHVERDQKVCGANEVQLRVNLRFRTITMLCDLIASDLKLPASCRRFMHELKWDGC